MTENARRWLFFLGGAGLALLLAGTVVALKIERGQDAGVTAPRPGGEAASSSDASRPARSQVTLGSNQAAAINLQVAPVTRQHLSEELRVVATVVPDESRISHIHTRVSGWVEKLHVSNTGESVRAGQPIVDIFSQELLASQAEYLSVRTLTGPPTAAVESGRARLRYFGMSDHAIDAIEKSGKPRRLVTLAAPRSGILAHRGIVAGTAVDPSTEIATILDLSRVWVWAEVPESAAAAIETGMPARLEFGRAGAGGIAAKVEFIDPILTETTRKLKVRFSLPNARGALRPGSYGTAVFQTGPRVALTVPRDAVVDTGDAQYVYVLTDGTSYAPRAVRTGTRLKDRIEILDGLSEEDRVAMSGVFLLDSESRLRASGSQGAAHGAHAPPAVRPSRPAQGHEGTAHD